LLSGGDCVEVGCLLCETELKGCEASGIEGKEGFIVWSGVFCSAGGDFCDDD